MTDGHFSRRAKTYEQENTWILSQTFIEPLIPAVFGGGRMLDVCAGTGIIAEYAQNLGWQATALDNNEDMLKNVASPVEVFCGDAHHMPFPSDSFDLVSCRQGIQYLDFTAAIREMLRVSRGQVRLLHGFINRNDIPLWEQLFEVMHGPNRKFFSCDMLKDAIDHCAHSGVEEIFLKNRERFAKPPHLRDAIDSFLADHPAFVEHHRIENQEDSFFYDLNWVLHIIRK